MATACTFSSDNFFNSSGLSVVINVPFNLFFAVSIIFLTLSASVSPPTFLACSILDDASLLYNELAPTFHNKRKTKIDNRGAPILLKLSLAFFLVSSPVINYYIYFLFFWFTSGGIFSWCFKKQSIVNLKHSNKTLKY